MNNDAAPKVYEFDHETGEFIFEIACQRDRLDGSWVTYPDNHASRTHEAPPSNLKSGFVARRRNGEWEVVRDRRGETVYSVLTGDPQVVTQLGELPVDVTTAPRPSAFHHWSDGAWIEDVEMKSQREKLRLAGDVADIERSSLGALLQVVMALAEGKTPAPGAVAELKKVDGLIASKKSALQALRS